MTEDTRTPVWVGQLELSAPSELKQILHPWCGDYRSARVLVRFHGAPLGFVDVHDIETEADLLVRASQQAAALHTDPIEPTAGGGSGGLPVPISVVVCTRERADQLHRSLASIQRLSYDLFEVLVVDNAPTDDSTRRVFESFADSDVRFRYTIEPVPGLSSARNRGLSEARHEIVAFTDDDTIVDVEWLTAIREGFSRKPGVKCVTGLLVSAELETASQRYFDRHCGWPTSMTPRVYEFGQRVVPSYPFSAGIFGAGANFAVDSTFMCSLGGFDTSLGAGSGVGGGEDLDAFLRIIFAGGAIAYEPSALVWHIHRASGKALRQQLHSWGRGLGAYVAKTALEPTTRAALLRQLPSIAWRVIQVWRQTSGEKEPNGLGRLPLLGAQASGVVVGTFYYLSRRWFPKSTSPDRN